MIRGAKATHGRTKLANRYAKATVRYATVAHCHAEGAHRCAEAAHGETMAVQGGADGEDGGTTDLKGREPRPVEKTAMANMDMWNNCRTFVTWPRGGAKAWISGWKRRAD